MEDRDPNQFKYRLAGYFALGYAFYGFMLFSIYFYGGNIGRKNYSWLFFLTYPFHLYCSLVLTGVFRTILKERVIAFVLYVGIFFSLIIFFCYFIPNFLLTNWNYDLFEKNNEMWIALRKYYLIFRHALAVYGILPTILYLGYKNVLRGIVRFWVLLGIIDLILEFTLSPGSRYFSLVGSIGALSVAYFLFNFSEEVANLTLKKERSQNHPDLLDQLWIRNIRKGFVIRIYARLSFSLSIISLAMLL